MKIEGIKAVFFDLDNTLTNYFKMKKECGKAALNAMIGAGLKMSKEEAFEELFDLHDKHGYGR